MCITIGACLVAAVIPIGTLVLSSIDSKSAESGQNMVAIFFKYSLVVNMKLVLACLFFRSFLACLVLREHFFHVFLLLLYLVTLVAVSVTKQTCSLPFFIKQSQRSSSVKDALRFLMCRPE